MIIGFQTSKYDGLSFFQELSLMHKYDINFFDIFFDGFMPSDISSEEWLLLDSLKKQGFTFTVHMPIDTPNLSRQEQDSLIDFILKIRPVTTTLHFNTLTFELLEYFTRKTKGSTEITIENTIPNFNEIYKMNYVEFMKEAVKRAKISATFDTGHANVCGFNMYDTINELVNNNVRIKTVHAHDNDGTRDSHSVIGEGEIDFNSFFDILKSKGQNPYVVIEHWDNNYASLENLRKINF